MSSRLYGPLVSTSDMTAHRDLFTATFGLAEKGRAHLDARHSEQLFGSAAGGGVDLLTLQTPGVDAGVVLCEFAAPGKALRPEQRRLHVDAFRVIDFYAPDFEAALTHAEQAGFPMASSTAAYELAEGAFREAHHEGPDHVVAALLGGPRDFFTEFAEVRDRVVSEPVSISLPLTDAAPTVAFYAEVFGWGVVYEYDFDDTSFSALLGTSERLRVRSSTVGPSRQQTYVNLVDYGLPPGSGGSLAGFSVAPARGLLGLVVLTDDLGAVIAGAGRAGAEHSVVADLEVAPYGRCDVVVVNAPFGAPHLVLETVF